jgi:hypothetical protein
VKFSAALTHSVPSMSNTTPRTRRRDVDVDVGLVAGDMARVVCVARGAREWDFSRAMR